MKKSAKWWKEKGQENLVKAKNWWYETGRNNVKAVLQSLENTFRRGLKVLCECPISWGAIIVCILVAFMGDQGLLDKWPALCWLAEVTLRIMDWLAGLLKGFLQWFVDGSEFLLPEKFVEWVKYIFALS